MNFFGTTLRKTHPWDVVLMLCLGLVGLATGWWASVILYDDALITFRVAENLAYGRGFVYNIGERVQVTTTPLYTMLLAGGTWLFGSALQAALPLNLALSTLIPVLTYDLGRRVSGRITGLAGALLITMAPLLIMAFSMESYLYVALILATMWAYAAGYRRLTGAGAGLTALVRGDGVLLGACLLIYDLLAWRRLRWRLIIPATAIPAGWYLFALIYYGDPFPATLGAKVAQGQFDWLGAYFLDGLRFYWRLWTNVEDRTTFYLLPILAGLGLALAMRTERLWSILAARDALYIAAFTALSVPAADWYYAALTPGLALLTGRGIQGVAEGVAGGINFAGRRLKRGAIPPAIRHGLAVGAAALCLLSLLAVIYPSSRAVIAQKPDWKAKIYPDTGRWIAENTNTPANLATIDIGHLGYWSGRRIIDIAGLAQPDVAPHLAQGDFGYAVRHYRPDMVLLGFSWLPEVQSAPWFQADYVPRRYFKFREYDEPLLLFSRREGVKIQPDSPPASEIQPLDANFNGQVALTGFHLNQPLAPGKPLELTLFWRADSPLVVDFTVFVQVVDRENNILAQQDSKPQDGFYSTRYWRPGEQIIDSHTFLIPADTPPGRYDILVGLYEVESGLRLQVLDEAGQFKSDHVVIGNW